LNHTLQSSPIITSPTMVAFGAMKQLLPKAGDRPFTGKIMGMFIFYMRIVSSLFFEQRLK
jgi:hypothetical protein